MGFLETLQERTADGRAFLVGAPVITEALAGQITRERYVAYLAQAWHHVRHTVPLMMAVGSRLPPRLAWLRREVAHYVEEEEGHDDWILADIRHAGGDPDAVVASQPLPATDAMVSHAWDTVMRRNPAGFFGMVFVLEGTSIALALQAADRIQATLQLPDRAFTYLRSHGKLDQEHIHHLAGILERLDDPADRAAVEDCARTMFWLYGSVFRAVGEATPAAVLRRSA